MPSRPCFVVTITTPALAFAPYNAVAAASFKISMDSMSWLLMSDISGFWTPSIMYRGVPLPSSAAPPRITIDGDVPGCPVVVATRTPVTAPERVCKAFPWEPLPISSLVTFEMAAVNLSLVTVWPYPVTTTSERLRASSSIVTLMTVFPLIGCSTVT